jgi:type VI secretion system protein ImpA
MEAPNMSKLRDTLRAMERVLLQMTPPDRGEAPVAQAAQDADAPAGPAAAVAAPPAPQTGAWSNREEAYAALEAIADYLSRIEPHSPTPYLLRRAVNWGRMPLPELMAEIIREEGDLNRLGHLLGLNG